MRSLVMGYALLGVFAGMERLLRRDRAAMSMEAHAVDRGTTRRIGFAWGYGFAAGLAAPILSRLGIGRIGNARLPTIGLILMVASMAVRAWAALTLGRFYTRTLRTVEDQPLIQSGPYRLVRHPGYGADLLMWVGFGLATRNWLVGLTVSLAMALVYPRRIRAEEALLAQHFGDAYRNYAHKTWRLAPGVY